MMKSPRETFLHQVRQAVTAGNRPGAAAGLSSRDQIGYQGGGSETLASFREEFLKAGGAFHLVPDRESAARKALELIQQRSASRVLLGRGPVLDQLGLPSRLNQLGIEVTSVDSSNRGPIWDPFFAADIGISGVDFLVAETGTVVLHTGPGQPRSLSLLPPVHIAIAERSQIVPDLFDLFEGAMLSPARSVPRSAAVPTAGESMPPHMMSLSLPSCISLITGPSKTGDIELRLVTGVHGPGEIHVVLIAA